MAYASTLKSFKSFKSLTKMSALRIDIDSPHCSTCSYIFCQSPILIGRSPRSQVCLPDLRVSLEHLQISWTDQGEIEVLDLYSKNGVWGGLQALKPGQAYRAEHQSVLRFLEYRVSLSISHLTLPESSKEDRAYQTARLAQSKSGWLLKHSYQRETLFWALPLQTTHEWTASDSPISFTSKSNGVQITQENYTVLIQPHLPWHTSRGEWCIFPLNQAEESIFPKHDSFHSLAKEDDPLASLYDSQGLIWMTLGGLGLIGGLGSWIYFMM